MFNFLFNIQEQSSREEGSNQRKERRKEKNMIKERREEKEIKSKIIRNRLLVVKVDSLTNKT